MESSVVCPVCTLYLRPGMTLKSHLESHPKQKVIEALVKLHSEPSGPQGATTREVIDEPILPTQLQQTTAPWMGQGQGQSTSTTAYVPAHVGGGFNPVIQPAAAAPSGNHSFFYQQIIGSTPQPQGGYLIPVFNQHMQGGMMPPCAPGYMYQQQVFVSGGNMSMRMLPCGEGAVAQSHGQAVACAEIDHKGAHIVEISEAEEPAQEEAERKHPLMRELDIKSHVEVGETQITTEVMPESPMHDSPPELQQEDLDMQEELQDKFKDMQTSPKYITLRTADQALEGAANGDHHFELDGLNIVLVNNCNAQQDYPDEIGFEHSMHEHENVSFDSARIRADENMPQESNSNASWSRAHSQSQFHEGGSSRMSTGMSTYDLLARESWEGSDASDVDAPPPYQSHYQLYAGEMDDDADLVISSTSRQGIEYKCSECLMTFICPKERRVHQADAHAHGGGEGAGPKVAEPREATATNLIGGALYKKKVKKLVIKPKAAKQEPQLKTEKIEPSFDHIFTSIMKVEEEPTDPLRPDALDQKELTDLTVVQMPSAVEAIVTLPPPPVICVICCTIIRDSRTLRQHQIDIHAFTADTKYKCSVCQERFASEPAYTEHLGVHPLECLFCGKYFHRAHNMQLHIKRHLGIRPFRCITCGKHFLTRQKLQEHIHIHTGESPLKCTMCEETFKRYSNLIQHRNRRHLNIKRKQKDFICATCGDVFHSKKKLAWHKEVHENRPKACLHCSEKFVHQSSLTRHVRRAHNERFVPSEGRDAENVECPICKGVYLRGSLDTHIKSHETKKGFSCSVCDKDFSTKWNLKLHKWTHAGRAQKPFKCELCKGAFVREADYTAHMNSHKAIRPYTCNYCGAQFIRKYNCQRHVKEHEKHKTFNCTVCGKKFHRSYYLNDHMRIHSGVRPFSCHICGKTSTTKSNHNKHVRIHHAREPVSTEN